MAKKLTVDRVRAEFKTAYQAKRGLCERELEDHKFSLGEQWTAEEKDKLRAAGIDPFVDNRIQPNVHLLTGLERQNRTDWRAYPRGDEDGVKADIATALFKDVIDKSDYGAKASDQFKDGVVCGEGHMELYLDYTDSLINGAPRWRKIDGTCLFPDPASREYDLSDARHVFKVTTEITQDDLVNLFPKKRRAIRKLGSGRLDVDSLVGNGDRSLQKRSYGPVGDYSEAAGRNLDEDDGLYDLIEKYYKKYVEKVFIGDKKTGELEEAAGLDEAEEFVEQYQAKIAADQAAYEQAVQQAVAQAMPAMEAQAQAAVGSPVMETPSGTAPIQMMDPSHVHAVLEEAGQLPPPPTEQDPERFIIIRRNVPEIWVFSFIPGMDEPLDDRVAWFYPKWKKYPFVPYFARFSTAPLTGDDRHLLIQGIVAAVKDPQRRHNKMEILLLRHLNSSSNSGWLSEEDAWVDPDKVEKFGTRPGVNLEYKRGHQAPSRVEPASLSQGHITLAQESTEAIKGITGINADLISTQEGGGDSGRAIALRQKQGLLMVQELFDNFTRTKKIAGMFMLSQLGEVYDTESAFKVLGEAFLVKHFPPPLLPDPRMPGAMMPMPGPDGQPMQYDRQMAEIALAEVLQGDLAEYDAAVGESVASDTQRAATAMEIKDLATTIPGLVPPDVLVKNSQLPETAKREILAAYERAQAAAQAQGPASVPAKKQGGDSGETK